MHEREQVILRCNSYAEARKALQEVAGDSPIHVSATGIAKLLLRVCERASDGTNAHSLRLSKGYEWPSGRAGAFACTTVRIQVISKFLEADADLRKVERLCLPSLPHVNILFGC
jgi:hypothetical protein